MAQLRAVLVCPLQQADGLSLQLVTSPQKLFTGQGTGQSLISLVRLRSTSTIC